MRINKQYIFISFISKQMAQKTKQKETRFLQIIASTAIQEDPTNLYDYNAENFDPFIAQKFRINLHHFNQVDTPPSDKKQIFIQPNTFVQGTLLIFHQNIKTPQLIILEKRRSFNLESEFILKSNDTLPIFKTHYIEDFKIFCAIRLLKTTKNRYFVKIISAKSIKSASIFKNKNEEISEGKSSEDPYAVVKFWQKGFPLKVFQRVKFGKLEANIKGMRINSTNEIIDPQLLFQNLSVLETLNLDTQRRETNKSGITSQNSMMDGDGERKCKICYGVNSTLDPLVNPCNCNGSNKYIHIHCLKNWVKVKLTKMKDDNEIFHMERYECEICRKRFPKIIIKNQHQYDLLEGSLGDKPYIALTDFQADNVAPNTILMGIDQHKKIATVGRLEENDLALYDTSISRRHATFALKENHMVLMDGVKINDVIVNSKFGTLVYDQNLQFEIFDHLNRGFQVNNSCFSLRIVKKSRLN